MKQKNNLFLFLSIVGLFVISCQSGGEKKKVEAVSSEQLANEIQDKLPEKVAEESLPGKKVYEEYCLDCHQADGSGVPNMHPPLGPGSWVGKEPQVLVNLMMKGLSGKVEVNGEIYNNFMPSHANLTNEEVADVLTYIRSSFGNQFDPITADMVKDIKSGK
ncbi:MAG: cytochrome c [Prolixibacteraceae bacterium]